MPDLAAGPEREEGTGTPPRAPARPDAGWRADFPLFERHPQLVYLDTAATAQKPRAVLDRLARFYADENANVHRGVYALSAEATATYDAARRTVARFLNAPSADEVVFTSGTTAAINLVASGLAETLRAGDEILVTAMEHHSNLVPWQLAAERTGAVVRAVPVTDEGELDLTAWAELLNERTRIVAVTHLSNVLGTINPVRRLADDAHDVGALVVVDGAQSAAHLAVDVQALGCDFFAASGHKMYGPTGIGVLWGRRELLDRMPPWQGGGGMIGTVTLERSTWAPVPMKFEAGTPHIAGAVGLAAACDWMVQAGRDALEAWEDELLADATARLGAIPGVRIYGMACSRSSVLSFALDCAHPHDLGTILDEAGVCVRAGHHCAAPLMARYGVPALARASFGPYNTRADVDALVQGVERVRELFG